MPKKTETSRQRALKGQGLALFTMLSQNLTRLSMCAVEFGNQQGLHFVQQYLYDISPARCSQLTGRNF